MSTFIPDVFVSSYAAQLYSVHVEDTKGRILYERQYDTKAECDRIFNELKASEEPYSFQTRTLYPVRLTAKAICIPNTASMLASVEDRIGQVVLGILFAAFDIVTLPIRLITLIPYTFCWKQETEHKIQALIRNVSEASFALEEGKVVLLKKIRVFPKITPGTINDKRFYLFDGGKIEDEWQDVYIAQTLAMDHFYKRGLSCRAIDGIRLHNKLSEI